MGIPTSCCLWNSDEFIFDYRLNLMRVAKNVTILMSFFFAMLGRILQGSYFMKYEQCNAINLHTRYSTYVQSIPHICLNGY